MKEENTQKILDDRFLKLYTELDGKVQEICRMISSLESKRVLSIVDQTDWSGTEKLSDLYRELMQCVEKCRNAITYELNHSKDPYADEEPFYPVSVSDDDMKWFLANIAFAERDHVLKISLPLLMPHINQSYHSNYIDSIIWCGLMEYSNRHPRTYDFEKDIVIAFCHVYDSEDDRKIKDHDNIETKHCIDRITQCFASSDHPFNCQLYQKSAIGKEPKTDIYVMSEATAKEHLFDVFSWDFSPKSGENSGKIRGED